MTLEEKISEVETLYADLNKDIQQFHTTTNIACTIGCSACCKSPEVEATILELLPFAWQAYQENKAEQYYDTLSKSNSLICTLFKPIRTITDKGGCSDYQNRPLICRLFGSSFMRDKNNTPTFLACKEIKTSHIMEVAEATKNAANQMNAPFVSNYYTRLKYIDLSLTKDQYPINEAMKKALETVMNYFHYLDPICTNESKSS